MSSTQERNKETHTSLSHSEEDDGAKTPKRTLLLIYILLVLDIAAYSLVVPLVPYILIAFGGSAMENGITFCGYCITQCISIYAYEGESLAICSSFYRFSDCWQSR